MKKVLLFLPSLWPGGGEKIAVDIAGHVLDTEFLIVTYINTEDTPPAALAKRFNIPVICLNKRPGYDPAVSIKLNRIVKDFRPDAVHAHLRVMHYLLPVLMLHKNLRCVYTVHQTAVYDAVNIIMKQIIGCAIKHYGVIPVGISTIVRKSIMDYYKIPEESTACIYNGIDTALFSPAVPYEALPYDTVEFTAAGRLKTVKNYPLMLQAFAAAAAKQPNIHLTILGEGDQKETIVSLIKSLQIEDKVTLAGLTNHVEDYLRRSHVFIMSSNAEGLPLSVLEAMAAGLPIVSTNAGGVSDIVTDGQNGLLSDIQDEEALTESIIKIASDASLRSAMSAQSLLLSKQYDISFCAAQYKKLYFDE